MMHVLLPDLVKELSSRYEKSLSRNLTKYNHKNFKFRNGSSRTMSCKRKNAKRFSNQDYF